MNVCEGRNQITCYLIQGRGTFTNLIENWYGLLHFVVIYHHITVVYFIYAMWQNEKPLVRS